MERKLRLLLVEDDPMECLAITQTIDEIEDICLIGATNNIVKALQLTEEGLPDAIILDLELHKGNGNGLEFLKNLKTLNLPTSPFVLITTHNTSTVTYEIARELGADFILSKHQEDYNAKNVVNFLHSMKKTLHNRVRTSWDASDENIILAQNSQSRINQRIINELNYVGISPKSLGFKYFTDTISLCIQDSSTDFKKALSIKYNKTPQSIERAMQNAIAIAWKTTHIDDLSKYYTAKVNPNRGVPTLMEFVSYYVCKNKNQ